MAKIVVRVIVDLDPVPGAFHTEASARVTLQDILTQQIPHYHPIVVSSSKLGS